MDFEKSLRDNTAPVAIDFSEDRNVLLIAFGGLALKLGIPMFEFEKVTNGLKNINKIYLRDHKRLWFHRGLQNIGNSVESILNYLQDYTSHKSTHKVVVIGNSGGGYAALLFGHLLSADEVHAFSPKTSIHPLTRLIQKDLPKIWMIQLLPSLILNGQKKYFDLHKVLKSFKNCSTHYHIYFSLDHRSDYFHATRIRDVFNVHLHPYRFGHHGLVKSLRNNGELREIIDQAISL